MDASDDAENCKKRMAVKYREVELREKKSERDTKESRPLRFWAEQKGELEW